MFSRAVVNGRVPLGVAAWAGIVPSRNKEATVGSEFKGACMVGGNAEHFMKLKEDLFTARYKLVLLKGETGCPLRGHSNRRVLKVYPAILGEILPRELRW